MQYIQAPSEEKILNKDSVFLSGTTGGKTSWQKYVTEALSDLPITIVNPLREDWDNLSEDKIKDQIAWEHDNLRKVRLCAFWFGKETEAPISLFELGGAIERHSQAIVVAADPKYPKLQDLTIQVNLEGFVVLKSLDKLIIEIRKFFDT